jgi:hypothetical protein
MNGPYTITITEGETVRNYVEPKKRAAIAKCRRLIRGSTEGALGDVKDADHELVRQLIGKRGPSGSVIAKEREL